jgi:hypothetical protein
LIDGIGSPNTISDDISDLIEEINMSARDTIVSGYDPAENKYECHVPTGANTKPNVTLVYDIKEKTWTQTTKRCGQAVFYSLSSGGVSKGVMGDSNAERIFDISDKTTYTANGEKIHARFASKHFDFGYPEQQKRLVFIKIKAKAKIDFKISIDIIMDFGQQGTISFEDIESESAYSQWAEDDEDAEGSDWDDDQWDAEVVDRKIEILAGGIAKNFQVVIRESENSENRSLFEIDEIVLEGNLLGR